MEFLYIFNSALSKHENHDTKEKASSPFGLRIAKIEESQLKLSLKILWKSIFRQKNKEIYGLCNRDLFFLSKKTRWRHTFKENFGNKYLPSLASAK